MTFWKWSKTAASNGTADSTCPFPEGMDPAAINDGARGMMAAAAKYRDDVAGLIVTTGTSTAFSISSNQGFDTFAHMHGAMICFIPHVTNGANGTSLNVDLLGVKPILPAPGVGLPGGVLVQGTPYAVTYNHTDNAFYLHGFFGNPYNIPLAGGLDYWGAVVPSSAYAFPAGQAISRTTYAELFAIMGTAHGPGDGSTTFNLPDKTGRASVMKEASASRLTATHFGGNSTVIGATGGGESKSLITANLPAYTPSGSLSLNAGSLSGTYNGGTPVVSGSGSGVGGGGAFGVAGGVGVTINGAPGGSFSGNPQGGSSQAFGVVQPSIVCNYIIRIL